MGILIQKYFDDIVPDNKWF